MGVRVTGAMHKHTGQDATGMKLALKAQNWETEREEWAFCEWRSLVGEGRHGFCGPKLKGLSCVGICELICLCMFLLRRVVYHGTAEYSESSERPEREMRKNMSLENHNCILYFFIKMLILKGVLKMLNIFFPCWLEVTPILNVAFSTYLYGLHKFTL